MTRQFAVLSVVVFFGLATLAYGEPRGKEGKESRGGRNGGGQAEHKPGAKSNNEKAGHKPAGKGQGSGAAHTGGNKSPGGEWSERTHGGKQSAGLTGGTAKSSGEAAGQAGNNRKSTQSLGAQGAAGSAAAGNRQAGKATGAQGAAAGAAGVNRNGSQLSGAQGAAAGAAAADRNRAGLAGAGGEAARYDAVRSSFAHPNLYGDRWMGDHPGAWVATGWTAGAAWAPTNWGAITGLCGYGAAAPRSYNYGVNVVNQGGNVMMDGQSVGTAEEFSQQAADLADSGAAADASTGDTWLPLGVFAMVRNEQQHPQLILQLAINKQGILRGNYTEEVTDNTQPIRGAVDSKTQRAAWIVGDNKQTVMEAGLADLSEGEAPALIHKNGKTDHWILVRLEQPQQAASNGQSPPGTN